MSLLLPVVGLFVALAASTGVFLHAIRTDTSRRTALLWAGGVGAISLGGFLFANAFAAAIQRLYLQQVKPVPVVTSPSEAMALLVAVGGGIGVLGLLLYGTARQSGSFDADTS